MLNGLLRRREPLDLVMVLGLALAAAGLVWTFWPIPDIDTDYFPRIRRAAFGRRGPRVLIDEAHGNTYTAQGRYQPFAHLLSRDGYRVSRGTQPFSVPLLRTVDVLVIANPRGFRNVFEPQELRIVHEWVAAGGSLLLATGRGSASGSIARAFGVELAETEIPESLVHFDVGKPPNHPIMLGRAEANEEVRRVITFVGQPLTPSPGAHATPLLPDSPPAQGVALEYAKGRVVVLGEAATLTANRRKHDGREIRFGINVRESDNQQLALNIMHWLSRVL